MPSNTQPRNERLLQQNLAQISKMRTSHDRRLATLVDGMEDYYKSTLGEDGYQDLLAKTPLKDAIKRYQARSGARRAASPAAAPRQAPSGGAGVPRPSDEDDEDYDLQYSTDTEQQLLEERRNATGARRLEIDATLEAIQRGREQHISQGLPFDDFDAEAIARKGGSADAGDHVERIVAEWDDGGNTSHRPMDVSVTLMRTNGTSGTRESVESAVLSDQNRWQAQAGGLSEGYQYEWEVDHIPHGYSGGVRKTGQGMSVLVLTLNSRDDAMAAPPMGMPFEGDDDDETIAAPVAGGAGGTDDFSPSAIRDAAAGAPHAGGGSAATGGAGAPSDDVSSEGDAGGAPASSPAEDSEGGGGSYDPGNVAGSGAPTEMGEAPDLRGAGTPDVPSGEDDEEDAGRGSLAGDDDADRGGLNDGSDSSSSAPLNGPDPAEEAQKEQQKEKEKKRRKIVMKMVLHWLIRLSPFIGVILVVALLASCVDQFLDYANPFNELFGGGGDSSSSSMSLDSESGTTNAAYAGSSNPTASGSGVVHRRNTGVSNSLPNVSVDYAGLNGMFRTDSEAGEEDEATQNDGTLSDAQQRVINACHSTASPGAGWCAAWAGDVFQNARVGVSYRGNARDWYWAWCDPSKAPASCEAGTVRTDPNRAKLKPGMIIAVPSSSSGTDLGRTYGHIGIYVGNGMVMHNCGPIATTPIDEWISFYGKYADVGWGWAQGVKLGNGEAGSSGGSEQVGDSLNLHISTQAEINKWAKKIDKYIAGRGCVKMGFKGIYFAEAAAEFGIDPRLSVCQANIEQSLGNKINPDDYYNLWGWGVYGSHKGMIQTSNARDACRKHAKGLAEGYGSSFGPAQVAKYCPGNSRYWPDLKSEAQRLTNM